VSISLYGFILGLFLWAALSAKASPRDPAQISFLGAWSLVASLLGFVPMAAVLGGFVLASRPRPVVEIVFPAPFHRSIFGQELVRRGIILMSIGVIVMAALVGLVFSRLYTIPAWLGALRVAFVVLPIVGLWWLGGHFSFYLVSRRGGSLQSVILFGSLFPLLLGPPLLMANVIFAPSSPAARILMAPALPFTELLLGFPLGAPELLVIGLTWAAFGLLAVLALRWPYEINEGDGIPVGPTAGGLSVERAPTPGFLRHLAIRLRFRYVDFGGGVRALLGRNLTLSMRSPHLLINVMTAGFVVLLGALLLISPGRRVSIAPLIMGMIVAMVAPLGSPSPAMEVGQLDLIRLLPFRPRDLFSGYVALPAAYVAAWSAVIGVVAIVTGIPVVLALLLFGAFGSMGLAAASLAFLAGSLPIPSALRSAAMESPVTFSPWLFPAFLIVMIEIIPLFFVWGTPSVFPLLEFVAATNMLLFTLFSVVGIARFARPL